MFVQICFKQIAVALVTSEIQFFQNRTLLDAQGLGLAGPQVGMMRRLCIVIDLPEDELRRRRLLLS